MSNLDNYTDYFYQNQLLESKKSAKVILPIVEEIFSPQSIIDIGCGVGAWLSEWKEIDSSKTVLGIDASFVNKSMLLINQNEFIEADLTQKLPSLTKSDLVMCLEVAEHLPESRAKSFVSDLTQLSDSVLFSAAVPGQEGTHHINEQFLSYWIPIFESNGFTCFDIIRPKIWADETVLWWYRQNCVLFVKDGNGKQEILKKMESFHGFDMIQKDLLQHKTNKYLKSNAEISRLLKNPLFYMKSIFNGIVKKFK